MLNPFESGDIRVTSPYGMRDGKMHKGIDLVGTSSTRIVAVEDATVAVSTIVTDRANKTWEWGNYVRLDLADGRRLYHCHLSRRLVRAGEKVKKGQVIGIMGDTGYAFGAHLHWEIRPAGFSLNSLDITEYSGIPNKKGVYDASSASPLKEEQVSAVYKTGDKVRILEGAVYTNGVKVPSAYLGKPYTVESVGTGRVLIRELYSWVENRYLQGEKSGASAPAAPLKNGDKVKILSGASYTNEVKVPSRYIGRVFVASDVREDRVLVRELNSWVKKAYVEKA